MTTHSNETPFAKVLLEIKPFNQEELLSLQGFLRGLLAEYRNKGLDISLQEIDTNYFELLKSEVRKSPELLLENLSSVIQKLEPEQVALLDVMVIFLLNEKDFKKALPEILETTRQEKILPKGGKEIIFPTFGLPHHASKKSPNI